VRVLLHSILALCEGYSSASRPAHFTPKECAADTHWTDFWVGLRAGRDV
jgi:hypothetical protein